MKIRGRFIGILAVLGLLIALVPLASAGAVAGTVTLSGGEKGQYFSDQTDDNIITIRVKDSDLTPLRMGTARLEDGGSDTVLDLAMYVVAGEKEMTQMFDGGLNNPLCNHDSDSDADGTDTPNERPSNDDERAMSGCDKGDAIAQNQGTALAGTDADSLADSYRFDLKKGAVARDRQSNTQDGAGVIGANDLMSVVVNGRTAEPSADGSAPSSAGTGPWFTVVEEGGTKGGGIIAVVIHALEPQDADNSVSITFKDTEFKFDSTTPLDLEETRARFGGSSFRDVNTQVTVDLVSDSEVTVASAVRGYTIISFAYDVKDSYADDKSMVTLNSTSAGDVRLAIDETTAASDTFTAKVAVFSQDDYSKIATQVGNDANDDGSSTAMDDMGVVNVDELNRTNGLSAATEAGNNRSLAMRVTRAAEKLFPDKDRSTVKASDFLDLVVTARHGDVINVVYQDASPATSVSDSARVDLEAPVVKLVGPSDNFFTNIATVTMSAEVTDADAGVDPTNIELTINSGTTGLARAAAVESPIENGYRVTAASQGTISEGKKEWFVGVKDKVGNVPVMNNPATEDVNEAPKGAAADLIQLQQTTPSSSRWTPGRPLWPAERRAYPLRTRA